MQLPQGTVLAGGRYTIKECIGDGGFGITYVAFDSRLEREIVLKEYFPDYMAKRDTTVSNNVRTDAKHQDDMKTGIVKFMKEAKTLALLNSISTIATVHDYFEENDTAYIVMEYIKGKSLKQMIKERRVPFTFDEAMTILEPCMKALQKVHEAGIIHRDFAPDNIIINNNGQAKIIDFGASRDFVSSGPTMTIMVKHGYAPFEQYSNAVKQGPYTDVYSIAAILYEMVTLEKPIPATDRVLEDLLPRPMTVNGNITPVQDFAIMKGLSVVYSARYQTVSEFMNALNNTVQQNANVYQPSQPYQKYQAYQPARQKANVNKKSRGLSKGAIIGIIASVVAAIAIICVAIALVLGGNSSKTAEEDEKSLKTSSSDTDDSSGSKKKDDKDTKKQEKESAVESEETKPEVQNSEEVVEEIKEMIRVGIVNEDPNVSGYRTANDADMKATFNEANGYDACFKYSHMIEEQIEYAEQLISDGVEYLVICPVEPTGWESVLEKAKMAGTEVVFFDYAIDANPSLYLASISSDISKQGEIATDWLLSQGLSEINVIHLQGGIGSKAQMGRSAGLENAAKAGKLKIVSQKSCEWSEPEAKSAVESIIASGKSFNVIYAENDDMAKGAEEALDEAGITHGADGDVIIIGFDFCKWALEKVYYGKWNCEVQLSPFQASYIDDVIRNGLPSNAEGNCIIVDDRVFDSETITQEDVEKYGI